MSTKAPKPTTSRRNVITSGLVPKQGRPRLWAFGYADLAKLYGLSEGAVRQRVSAGQLDPADLRSIVALANRIEKRKA